MITLDKAKEIALRSESKNMEICTIYELPGKWVFSFRDAETKEEPDIPGTSVDKDDGTIGVFFPPDCDEEELEKMKRIEGKEDLED